MGIAAGMKDIVQDIVSSRDARVAEVKELKEEANEMLGSFKASHKKMGAQLRRELADDKAKMEAEVKAIRKELIQGVTALRSDVKGMLKDFRSSHKQMSTELKQSLAQGEAARKSEAQQLGKENADYVRGIKSEVAGMRQETKADMGEARAAWQGLTRGVKKAAVKATPKVVRAEVAEAALMQEETPDLEAKLLAAIKEHPEGITLTDVAESLGVAPVVFGRAVRKLLGEGKIRKEDKTYFPVRAE